MMALAEEAQALTVAKFGPLNPCLIEIWPGAISAIIFRNKKWVKFRSAITASKIQHLILKSFQTTYTRTPDNTYPVGIDLGKIKTGILYGLIRSNQCVLCKPVHFSGLFAVKKIFCHKIFEFAGKLGFKKCCIKIGYWGSTTHAIDQTVPVIFYSITNWR